MIAPGKMDIRKTLRLHKRSFLVTGLVAALLGAVAGVVICYFRQAPQLIYSLKDIKVDKTIQVSFTRPVQSQLVYQLSPALAGKWQVTRNWLGITAITFYPRTRLVPGSSYSLAVGRVAPLLATKPTVARLVIPVSVEKPPAIKDFTPAGGAANVQVDTAITVRLAAANRGLRRLSLAGDVPLAAATPTGADDITFSWKLAKPLSQGTAYHLELSDLNQVDPVKRALLAVVFTTVPEPRVTGATDQNYFYPGNTITVSFDQDMVQTDADFRLNMPGSGRWLDARDYQFTPSGLQPGHDYPYTILAGSKALNGGVTESDHGYKISTPGVAYVTGLSPGGYGWNITVPINVSFDQPVDHGSAQAAFHLSPSAAGGFGWSGNTMTFYPGGLAYQTTYQASLDAGVQSLYGLPTNQTYATSFSTTYRIITLNVPQYYQAYTESCEEASLRMALALYGVATNDYDILQNVGYDPRPRDTATNTWDNPYLMFVGDVNGAQDTTGYGVFAPPIAHAAQLYGRGATVASGVSAGYIAQQIYDGHPVIAWGYSKNPVADSWNVPGGGTVATYKGEHVRVIYGVAGSSDNIVGFYIHDPIFGNLYWTPSQLMANMNIFGNTSNQTVTVY